MDIDRKKAVLKLTGAFAVAWEGAGGARACHYEKQNGVIFFPYTLLEISEEWEYSKLHPRVKTG